MTEKKQLETDTKKVMDIMDSVYAKIKARMEELKKDKKVMKEIADEVNENLK